VASRLAQVLNDDTFRSLEGKSKHQLWLELCDVITRHPKQVEGSGVDVDAVLRGGIRRFTDEVRGWGCFFVCVGGGGGMKLRMGVERGLMWLCSRAAARVNVANASSLSERARLEGAASGCRLLWRVLMHRR